MNDIKQCVAAKAIIKNGAGQVLVLQQNSEATVENANRYHAPGGMLEPGEKLSDTLLREVQEETGQKGKILKLLSVEEWSANIRGQQCQFVGVFYECKIDNEIGIKLDHESSGYKWVDNTNLGSVDIVEPSLSVIKKALDEQAG